MSTSRSRLSVGPDVDLFVEYRNTGSRALRNRLVEQYQPVADRCALRFAGRGEATDDLRQVALIGLIKAVERFDPFWGVASRVMRRRRWWGRSSGISVIGRGGCRCLAG